MYRKRLIATIVSIFAIGVVFGVFFDNDTLSFRALFVVASLLSVLFAAVSYKKDNKSFKKMTAVALAVAAFSFGVLRIGVYNEIAEKSMLYDQEKDNAFFEISEISSTYIDARVLESEIGVAENTLVRVYYENEIEDILIGDRFSAEVTYRYREGYKFYSKGITLTASGVINQVEEGNGLFYKIRKTVSEKSEILFGRFESAGAISKAIVVGDRSGLDSHLFSVYKNSGISHVVAISGLHISLIAMGLYNFLASLSIKRKICSFIAIFASFCYTALIGFTPGAVRAMIMILFVLVSRLVLRRADSITTIFISLMVLLLMNPYSICSAGLQLSFVCSLGIILFEPIICDFESGYALVRRKMKGFKRIHYTLFPATVVSLGVSFVSAAFSFTVVCFSFDTVSYISPIVNLIAVPLFSYGVKIAFAAYLLSPISESLAKLVAYPSGILFDAVTDFSEWIYGLNIGSISVYQPFMIIPFVFSVLIIASLAFSGINRKRNFFITSALFCVSLIVCGIINNAVLSDKTVVEYSSEEGQFVYFQTHEQNVYVDINGYNSDPEVVFKNGKTGLDNYVMTELNAYSLKRFEYLSGNMNVSELHLPNPKNSYESNVFSQIKALANKRKCDIITFDEFYSNRISEQYQIGVFGKENDISEEMLICVDVADEKIWFLGNGYENAVKCDTAVVLNGFSGDENMIICDNVYAEKAYFDKNEDTKRKFSEFENRLRIEFSKSESGLKIYEP